MNIFVRITHMSETSTLYRKYRPHSFDEIIGQDQVITALKNSLKNNSISHSYLFSGGRGTGKTSIARIFATELGTAAEDIYEIDAASNRGINEIRELRDGVSTRPFSSDYKFYIIDEAHMLTKEAFNALLKTLEEPPSHVVFILATTEKHKILDTIISRCQVFDFNRPGTADLEKLINHVAKQESREIDADSVKAIAKMGDGSYRDTLSQLQTVFAHFDGNITFDEYQRIFGGSPVEAIRNMLTALAGKDQQQALESYHVCIERNAKPQEIITALLGELRTALLIQSSPVFKTHFAEALSEDEISWYQQLTVNTALLKKLLDVSSSMQQSSQKQASLELGLLEICNEG